MGRLGRIVYLLHEKAGMVDFFSFVTQAGWKHFTTYLSVLEIRVFSKSSLFQT